MTISRAYKWQESAGKTCLSFFRLLGSEQSYFPHDCHQTLTFQNLWLSESRFKISLSPEVFKYHWIRKSEKKVLWLSALISVAKYHFSPPRQARWTDIVRSEGGGRNAAKPHFYHPPSISINYGGRACRDHSVSNPILVRRRIYIKSLKPHWQ